MWSFPELNRSGPWWKGVTRGNAWVSNLTSPLIIGRHRPIFKWFATILDAARLILPMRIFRYTKNHMKTVLKTESQGKWSHMWRAKSPPAKQGSNPLGLSHLLFPQCALDTGSMNHHISRYQASLLPLLGVMEVGYHTRHCVCTSNRCTVHFSATLS
jgi:hypothetical protein